MGEENTWRFIHQQKARASGEAAKIANVGKMIDEQRVEAVFGQDLSNLLLAARKIHSCEFIRPNRSWFRAWLTFSAKTKPPALTGSSGRRLQIFNFAATSDVPMSG